MNTKENRSGIDESTYKSPISTEELKLIFLTKKNQIPSLHLQEKNTNFTLLVWQKNST